MDKHPLAIFEALTCSTSQTKKAPSSLGSIFVSYYILLEEVEDLNKLLATFSKQVVEMIILLLFLGEKWI